MSHSIRHRGPDDDAIFLDHGGQLALAFRRLSIIDLSSASRQPMSDAESAVTLVFNGELYNFRELREQLRGLGHAFRSEGDAEVVLRSYLHWGIGCLDRFAGMFAFALWDARDGKLHLARDPLGMKPLYYVPRPGGLAFASEVKAFASLPGFRMELSPSGLQQFLEFGYVFDDTQTILAGVAKVPPGCRVEATTSGAMVVSAYYQPPAPDPGDRRGERERLDELEAVMETVVAQHLVADVPVGLLLSGGLDSSVVAALAARRNPLLTISMGFAESSVDERQYAAQVASHVGSRHLELLIKPSEVMAEIEDSAWVFDDLFADWGTMTTRLMYRRCREQGIKVVLVGEGADELFGGYGVFEVPQRLGLWQQFRLYQRYSGRRHGKLFGKFRRAMSDYLAEGGGDSFHAVRLFETRRQLPNQYVMKVDKASMAESVEARAPYLDRRVADLAFRTPREWLQRAGENKYLLRALSRRGGLLPAAISQRPKFGAPLAASWMDDNDGFRRFSRERILGGSWAGNLGFRPAMSDFFDRGKQGQSFPGGVSIFRNLAWRLLLLELWSAHYLHPRAA